MVNKLSKENLKKYRDKIDVIDSKLLKLMQTRANAAFKIGQIKLELDPNSSLYKPDREADVLRNILKENDGKISDKKIKIIFRELIAACLSLEEKIKVAYLGPEGTHSEAALINKFGSSAFRVEATSIEDVFKKIQSKEVSLGIVPVENSSEGVINSTLNSLADHNLMICGESYFDIHHQLASAKKMDIKNASVIASHPQAIGQCSKWIEANLGNIERKIMNSSAEAALFAKENKSAICIVNDLAIEKYKLFCQEKNIEDTLNNQTRFLVIGTDQVGKTAKDKTSFLIQTENKPGSLLKILKPFEKKNINLNKIETRPSRTLHNSHDFFIDTEGHQDDAKLKSVIKEIQSAGASLRIIGSYPEDS